MLAKRRFASNQRLKKKAFRVPARMRNKELVGFRSNQDTMGSGVRGQVDKESRNFFMSNWMTNKERTRFFAFGVCASIIPIFLFLRHSEQIFTSYKVKEKVSQRRDRLNEEHSVDKDRYFEAEKAIDETYRISEKEEIMKLRTAGKSPRQAFMPKSATSQKDITEQLLNEDAETKVRFIQSGKEEQIRVDQKIDAPDPRVHGATIIFDSRMD